MKNENIKNTYKYVKIRKGFGKTHLAFTRGFETANWRFKIPTHYNVGKQHRSGKGTREKTWAKFLTDSAICW